MLLTVLESAHLSTAGLSRDSLTSVLTIVLNSTQGRSQDMRGGGFLPALRMRKTFACLHAGGRVQSSSASDVAHASAEHREVTEVSKCEKCKR